MKSISELPQAARKQGGVFTAAQAEAEGWTSRQIRRRLSSGRWRYVAGRALARADPGSAGWTDFQLAMAATLTIQNSVISHQTAAAFHGFPLPKQASAHVITDDRHKSCPNITIHRLRLDSEDIATGPSGIRVTGDRRTAIDLLSVLSQDDALDLWAWVSSRKILDVPGLESAVESRRHWSGISNLKALARTVQNGAVSKAELRLHELLRRAGITGWEAGVTLFDGFGVIGVVDLIFSGSRLVVEVDGFRAHSARVTFDRDRQRQNRLVTAGFTVLRFTWTDLQSRPIYVITQITRQLANCAPI